MGDGLRLLKAAGYVAQRDDGDPDRPIGTVDLYVEQHYGMINPDRRVRDQLDRGLGVVLDAAGIAHEYRSGGVVRGAEYPRSEEMAVKHAASMKTIGFTIRATSAREADRQLTMVAQTLGVPRGALTIDPRAGWDTDWL
ncbi:MAG: hypothetical protein M3P18_05350 [Actinomycetota bacterium]|nr:hypothetical protein [Actinomycetota bacterium]